MNDTIKIWMMITYISILEVSEIFDEYSLHNIQVVNQHCWSTAKKSSATNPSTKQIKFV